jgi:hypothetical protein
VIAYGDFLKYASIHGFSRGSVPGPINTVAPVVSGTAEVGQTLTLTDGTWTGTGVITYAKQWYRNGIGIAGAAAGSYEVGEADIGAVLTGTVRATDDNGTRSKTSLPTAVVPDDFAPPPQVDDIAFDATTQTAIDAQGTQAGKLNAIFTALSSAPELELRNASNTLLATADVVATRDDATTPTKITFSAPTNFAYVADGSPAITVLKNGSATATFKAGVITWAGGNVSSSVTALALGVFTVNATGVVVAPPPVASGGPPLLTDARMATIQASIVADPTTYNYLVSQLEPITTGAASVSDIAAVVPGLALRLAIDGASTPQVWQDFFKTQYLSLLTTFLYTGRNDFRQYGADICMAYSWVKYHYPELFSDAQKTTIEDRLTVYAAYWSDYYNSGTHASAFPVDSDETAMVLLSMLVYQDVTTGSTYAACVTAHDALKPVVEGDYIVPDATMAGGFWNESTSYNANTPRFYQWWRMIHADRGGVVMDSTWSQDFALFVLFSMRADLSGYWMFNDVLDQSPTHAGYYTMPSNSFRSGKLTENGMIGSQGTDQRRALLYIHDELKPQVVGRQYNYPWIRLIVEDAASETAAAPATLTLPYYFYSGGKGVFHARSNWTETANQFVSCNFRVTDVHHVLYASMSYEIYHDSTPISMYSGQNTSAASAPQNMLYIENFYTAGGLYPGVVDSRCKGDPTNLGSFADSVYASVTWESKDVQNQTGYNRTADYALQCTRSILNFWDGLTVAYDHVITDPSQVQDINTRYGTAVASYTRQVMRLTRFMGLPVLDGGAYKATALGKDHYYKPLIAPDSTTIINEVSGSAWADLSAGNFFTAHRGGHIQEFVNGETDVEFASAQTWGDTTAVAVPTTHILTGVTGTLKGWAIQHAGTWRICVFNTDPETPITTTTSFTMNAAVTGEVKLYAVGFSQATSFTPSRAGSVITITAGSGSPANSGAVVTATLAA